MLEFCGEERCRVDANGRIRLTQRWVDDFLRKCNGEVVMYVLPEGAVALYPEETYREMRAREISDTDNVGASFAARRSLRRYGSLTMSAVLTRQGRVTLPERFRKLTGLQPGVEACVVGVEIGVEIWTSEKFDAEMDEADIQLEKQRQLEYNSLTEGAK
jgi:DNA-binding transcriptional regulator/RsmH inhibitor MraZ